MFKLYFRERLQQKWIWLKKGRGICMIQHPTDKNLVFLYYLHTRYEISKNRAMNQDMDK